MVINIKDCLMFWQIFRTYCQESNEESSEAESAFSLKCHISQEVNHLHEGLKNVSTKASLFPLTIVCVVFTEGVVFSLQVKPLFFCFCLISFFNLNTLLKHVSTEASLFPLTILCGLFTEGVIFSLQVKPQFFCFVFAWLVFSTSTLLFDHSISSHFFPSSSPY